MSETRDGNLVLRMRQLNGVYTQLFRELSSVVRLVPGAGV